MNNIVVTVMMSVYNTNISFLREAIDSVLQQTFKDFEFLITDDCSDAKTKQVLDDYASRDKRVRIISNDTNKGLTMNLNHMIDEAKGKYLARMDADDVCFPNRFMEQVQFLDHHPDIVMAGTWYNIIEKNQVIGFKKEAYLPYQMKARLFFYNSGNMHSSMMMRRAVFNKAHNLLYDVTMKKTQDYDLWVRVTEKYKICLIPKVLMSYRVSDGQISTASYKSQSTYRDRVIVSQLGNLIENYTSEEKQLHLSYCTGGDTYSSNIYMKWGKRLIESNHQLKLYDIRAFDYYAYSLMIRRMLRAVDRKLSISLCKQFIMYCYAMLRFYVCWGWDVITGHF